MSSPYVAEATPVIVAPVPETGRIRSFMDTVTGYITEQRLAAGLAVAGLALSLAACGSPAGHNAAQGPVTTAAAGAEAADPATTTTTELPLVLSAEFHEGEQAELATATGLPELASAKLRVFGRMNSIESEVVFVGLDGYKPSDKTVNELKTAINLAEVIAGRNPNMAAKGLQLGTGSKQDVGYQLGLSHQEPKQRERHFIIFTADQQVVTKLIPTDTPQGGYTKPTNKGMNVSILPATANLNRDAFLEGFRTSMRLTLDPAMRAQIEAGSIDVSNLRKPNVTSPTADDRIAVLVSILAQRQAQSWANARLSAAAGESYDAYAAGAIKDLVSYAKTGAQLFAVSRSEYEALSYPS